MSELGDKVVKAIRDKGEKLDGEMSFFDHLSALRGHLVRAALAILLFAILAFSFYDKIFRLVIMAPARTDFITYRLMCHFGDFMQSLNSYFQAKDFCVEKINVQLINTELAGQFTLQLDSSLIIGLVFGIPYLLYELWKFIKPALHENERKAASGFVFYASLLFLGGVAFGYFIVTPLSVKFLSGYVVSDAIQNLFSIDSYISSVSTLTLASGLVFELPILVYILANLGILTPKFMRKHRRYAVIIILVIAAIVTPTPDALTMSVVALPLLLLYELSITVAGAVERRKRKKEEMAA